MQLEMQCAEWVSRLVQIPSVTPDQAGPRAGETGEAAIGRQIAQWFNELGGEVHVQGVRPGRANVYGIWRGTSERWLAVDVHIDTVGVEQMSDPPFDGRIEEDRVYGRGAVDTKASLGIILALLEQMQQTGQRPAYNLLIGATVDEEIGTTGAPAFASWMAARQIVAEQMIIAEPTLCTPVHGHKGVVRLLIDVAGKAAHSSQPHMGQNAVVAAARLVLALDAENARLQTAPATPLGHAYLTPTVIHGGVGINVVPDACQLFVDRRVVETEDAHAVMTNLVELAEANCPLPIEVKVQKELDAFYQPGDSAWMQQLADWSGIAPEVAPYGTNAWAYPNVARERVVMGPGSIDQAHGATEWVEISQLAKMAHIYQQWWGIAESVDRNDER